MKPQQQNQTDHSIQRQQVCSHSLCPQSAIACHHNSHNPPRHAISFFVFLCLVFVFARRLFFECCWPQWVSFSSTCTLPPVTAFASTNTQHTWNHCSCATLLFFVFCHPVCFLPFHFHHGLCAVTAAAAHSPLLSTFLPWQGLCSFNAFFLFIIVIVLHCVFLFGCVRFVLSFQSIVVASSVAVVWCGCFHCFLVFRRRCQLGVCLVPLVLADGRA